MAPQRYHTEDSLGAAELLLLKRYLLQPGTNHRGKQRLCEGFTYGKTTERRKILANSVTRAPRGKTEVSAVAPLCCLKVMKVTARH